MVAEHFWTGLDEPLYCEAFGGITAAATCTGQQDQVSPLPTEVGLAFECEEFCSID